MPYLKTQTRRKEHRKDMRMYNLMRRNKRAVAVHEEMNKLMWEAIWRDK